MNYPKMVIFDYGHTLLYEPEFDSLRGERAMFERVKSNPRGVSVEEANDFAVRVFREYNKARESGFEIHEWQALRFIYEYLQIEFDVSIPEIERIFWEGTTPGKALPGVHEMLDYLNTHGIRSAVISNICFSGAALAERLNRLLPENRFEFVMTSSEYVFRKPNPLLFELALRKAGLDASDVWYCGDNPTADVMGASGVGIFPVWYDNDMEKDNRSRLEETVPACEHLHIKEWDELIAVLERMK